MKRLVKEIESDPIIRRPYYSQTLLFDPIIPHSKIASKSVYNFVSGIKTTVENLAANQKIIIAASTTVDVN